MKIVWGAAAALAIALLYRKQYISFAVVLALLFIFNRIFRRDKASSPAIRSASQSDDAATSLFFFPKNFLLFLTRDFSSANEDLAKLKRLFPEVQDSALRQQLGEKKSLNA